MTKKILLSAIALFCFSFAFSQNNQEVEYVGDTGYRLPNTLDIIYARLEQPAYHNEFAEFIIKDESFPQQEGHTPQEIEKFRNEVTNWVLDNPEKIISLWEARTEAANRFANPDPNYIPPTK